MPSPSRSATAPPHFAGFGPEALLFYEGLEADNSRSYWSDHLADYERAVRDPMLALLAELEPEFGELKLFRPHRDVRFTKDKSPYKTHAGGVTKEPAGGCSFYVQMSADGLLAAAGVYRMERDQLQRYRAAVLDDAAGAALTAVTEGLVADGFRLEGETLVRVPRGTDPGHPRADLLRRKSLAAFLDHGAPDWVWKPECRDRVADTWRRLRPLEAWITTHVGPPERGEGDVGGR